jgi:hypothetical protein
MHVDDVAGIICVVSTMSCATSRSASTSAPAASASPTAPAARGLHSSTSQLNLSRVCQKKTPCTH